ncbi:ATPase involved in DNA repair/chromosome segregation [Giardia duodenalis]|uniref:ATPase involved in DNA repair/chromosome segregation n=1 Tax=Giardia intestinalis TaxID=5741 RepID=V6TVT0_GIAIN|nr:ATPase involved in DNA repair/chromosome segregation [Giardia intestinalis]
MILQTNALLPVKGALGCILETEVRSETILIQ